MKKANTIISLFLISSLFAATAVSGVTLNSDSKLALNCSQDVYGIQFDMHFDPSLISVDELTGSNSLVPGVDLFSKVKEDGFVKNMGKLSVFFEPLNFLKNKFLNSFL